MLDSTAITSEIGWDPNSAAARGKIFFPEVVAGMMQLLYFLLQWHASVSESDGRPLEL